MTLRLWPRSLQGQLLLSVAIALLLAQGFGAILIYRAQDERRAVSIVHVAAFRLLTSIRPFHPASIGPYRPDRFPEVPRSLRVERVPQSPIRPDEVQEPELADMLRRVLADQDFDTDQVLVVRRDTTSDPAVDQRLNHEKQVMGGKIKRPDRFLLMAVHQPGANGWLVVRVLEASSQSFIISSLLAQTLLIYAVIVGAIALILRRITRPLAALTSRVEHFAETRDLQGRVAPQGPDDIRRLIVALSGMEDRISALLGEKDVMLGAIGHDLKTPLAALRVRIESVEDETERRKMAATIEDIVRTLDDILSLARVGRPTDPLEPSELSALVAAVVEEFEDMGGAVTLADMPRMVMPLRATWLRRALRNLIGNSLRYGLSAHVSLLREPHFAVIRIDDEGPGIGEGEIARMLEPFTRGEPSRNSETGGAGLGLTLAKAIAEQHGGSLALANRIGEDGKVAGLRAELRLPLA